MLRYTVIGECHCAMNLPLRLRDAFKLMEVYCGGFNGT